MPDVFTPFKQKVRGMKYRPQSCFACLQGLAPDPVPSRPLRVQCEDRSQVRPCLPAPKPGSLPLPVDLDPAQLAFQPQRVEDLNAAVPKGHPQLATPQRDARVSSSAAMRLLRLAVQHCAAEKQRPGVY